MKPASISYAPILRRRPLIAQVIKRQRSIGALTHTEPLLPSSGPTSSAEMDHEYATLGN
jgi:hypothetical protein